MSLLRWLSRSFRPSSRRFPRDVRRRARPRLELLEDRVTPTVFHVTTTADLESPTGPLSLRTAVQLANSHPGPDTIVLPAGTFKLTRFGAFEDSAVTGDLDITTDNLTIQGSTTGQTIIDGNGVDRVFDIHGALTVAFSNLIIQGGLTNDYGGGINDFDADTTLTLTHCTLQDNSAFYQGGGLYFEGGALTLTKCTIQHNTAGEDGGGVWD